VLGFCEHGNEHSDFVQVGIFWYAERLLNFLKKRSCTIDKIFVFCLNVL
jgi:hypothetical protein